MSTMTKETKQGGPKLILHVGPTSRSGAEQVEDWSGWLPGWRLAQRLAQRGVLLASPLVRCHFLRRGVELLQPFEETADHLYEFS